MKEKRIKGWMMWVCAPCVLLLVVAPAFAQRHSFEISADIGYTFSEGVEISPIDVGGVTYDQIDPESGFSYGVDFGYFVSRYAQLGFLMSQQQSNLIAKGRTDRTFVDLDLNNYFGYVAYNFGFGDEMTRPFILFGMGASHYVTGKFEGREIDNETRFATTWGGGVKVFPGENLGVRFMGRWTPTYIKTDAAGWWCDPFWGCYVVGNADYSHQFELSAGAIYRF